MSGVVPLILACTALWGLRQKVDVYSALTRGASEGIQVVLHILPPLVALLSAAAMFRASGALAWFASLFAPLLNALGIPAELTPLMLIRPLSGSGALGTASELISTHGPDSFIGRVAAVMMGSTETTFYTVAVYFGAAGIQRSRHTIPAALAADFTGFFVSTLAVRLLFR